MYSYYLFKFSINVDSMDLKYWRRADYVNRRIEGREQVASDALKIADLMGKFIWKMDSPVTHMLSFFDQNSRVLHVQPFETGHRAIMIYRILDANSPLTWLFKSIFSLNPGFTSPDGKHLYLDTSGINRRWFVDEYMNDKMDRVKSMKLETVFEN